LICYSQKLDTTKCAAKYPANANYMDDFSVFLSDIIKANCTVGVGNASDTELVTVNKCFFFQKCIFPYLQKYIFLLEKYFFLFVKAF